MHVLAPIPVLAILAPPVPRRPLPSSLPTVHRQTTYVQTTRTTVSILPQRAGRIEHSSHTSNGPSRRIWDPDIESGGCGKNGRQLHSGPIWHRALFWDLDSGVSSRFFETEALYN